MKKTGFLLTALSAAMLCGCQDSINTVENAEKHQNMTAIEDARVQTDSFLADRLIVLRVNAAPGADGLMVAQVTVSNNRTGFWSESWSSLTGENPYRVAYMFLWYDDNGMEVRSPAQRWEKRDLIPGQTASFRAVAPSPRCKDFVISLREAE